MILVSSCSCLSPILWSCVLSREWRRCSNYIWVIMNLIAYSCATYVKRFDGRWNCFLISFLTRQWFRVIFMNLMTSLEMTDEIWRIRMALRMILHLLHHVYALEYLPCVRWSTSKRISSRVMLDTTLGSPSLTASRLTSNANSHILTLDFAICVFSFTA